MSIVNQIFTITKYRRLFVNFSVRSAANLLSKTIGLITLPIITRALGPANFGDYNFALIVTMFTFYPVSLLGFKSYGIRVIAGNEKKDSYALNIISMQFTVAVISVLVSSLVILVLFNTNRLLLISIFLSYIMVCANSLNLEFFFVAKKDLVFPTIAYLTGQVFYTLGVILFIHKPNDIPFLIFFSALVPMVSNLMQLYKFHIEYCKIKILFSLKETFTLFKTTYKLGISNIFESMYPSIPQIFIPILLNSYALGIFSGGYKVSSIIVIFYITFFQALSPYLVKLNKFNKKKKIKLHLLIFTFIIAGGSILSLGLFLFGAKFLIFILGRKFAESVPIFQIISLTLIPFYPISMFFNNVLIFAGNDKCYFYSTLVSTLVILIASPLLISYFGLMGSVYSLAISLFFGILTSVYFYIKTEILNQEVIFIF